MLAIPLDPSSSLSVQLSQDTNVISITAIPKNAIPSCSLGSGVSVISPSLLFPPQSRRSGVGGFFAVISIPPIGRRTDVMQQLLETHQFVVPWRCPRLDPREQTYPLDGSSTTWRANKFCLLLHFVRAYAFRIYAVVCVVCFFALFCDESGNKGWV